MPRYTFGRSPYRGVLFNGWAFQIVDNKPTRDVGWDEPVSGHVVFELVVPTAWRRDA